MLEREYHPEFPHRQLPKVVDGFEGIAGMLELFRPGKRSMLDLNVITQMLPPTGRQTLERAIWEIVEIVSVEGVIPDIIEIDRFGNPV